MFAEMQYKPGLTMDAPVAVTLAAADWMILMSWFNTHDSDGINYLIYGPIATQLMEAVYTPASRKAMEAKTADRPQHPILRFLMGTDGQIQEVRPEDFGAPE